MATLTEDPRTADGQIVIDDHRKCAEWVLLMKWFIDNWDDVFLVVFVILYRGEDDSYVAVGVNDISQHIEWLSKHSQLVLRKKIQVYLRTETQETIFKLKFT